MQLSNNSARLKHLALLFYYLQSTILCVVPMQNKRCFKQMWTKQQWPKIDFCLFDSLHPINNLSVMQGRVFLGWNSTKLGLMCLAQGHNAVTPARLEPTTPRSRGKHSTTEPLCSLKIDTKLNQTHSPIPVHTAPGPLHPSE